MVPWPAKKKATVLASCGSWLQDKAISNRQTAIGVSPCGSSYSKYNSNWLATWHWTTTSGEKCRQYVRARTGQASLRYCTVVTTEKNTQAVAAVEWKKMKWSRRHKATFVACSIRYISPMEAKGEKKWRVWRAGRSSSQKTMTSLNWYKQCIEERQNIYVYMYALDGRTRYVAPMSSNAILENEACISHAN